MHFEEGADLALRDGKRGVHPLASCEKHVGIVPGVTLADEELEAARGAAGHRRRELHRHGEERRREAFGSARRSEMNHPLGAQLTELATHDLEALGASTPVSARARRELEVLRTAGQVDSPHEFGVDCKIRSIDGPRA